MTSLPLILATHVVLAECPRTVRQLCEAFPHLTYKQIDCACWRAARAGWLKRERFDKRSIAYAPGVINGRHIPDDRVRKAVERIAAPTKPVIPEGIPLGVPSSVWDLPAHGWPAQRTPTNYWPEEAEEA